METYYSSIFNEVFGPVMVGTSSSHTAGPYRIGAMARMLLKDPVKKGRISFDPTDGIGVQDLPDEGQRSVEDLVILQAESAELHQNIAKLSEHEQFIIKSIYFEGI